MTPEEEQLIRARQRARATVMAWVLGGLVVLFFVATIAKIQASLP